MNATHDGWLTATGDMPCEDEHSREHLSQVILATLASWPDAQRGVFIQSHYGGQNASKIAASVALTPGEVDRMLDDCNRKLNAALKEFRTHEHRCPGTGGRRQASPSLLR